MGKFKDQIDWLRKQIGHDENDRDDYRSGHREEFEFDGDRRVNVTAQADEAAASRIARNKKLVDAYERLEEDGK